jgi:hypothetical protein
MVRLIRLTTTNENAVFDNDFSPNIEIKANSQVALKSLSLENVISEITINSENDKINFQTADNDFARFQVQLTHAKYDTITAPSLFRDMTTKLNGVLNPTINPSNVGMEIDCFVPTQSGQETKFEVAMLRGNYSEHTGQLVLDKGAVAVQRQAPSAPYYTPASAPTGNNCFMYDPRPIARGGGVVRFKIRRVSTANANCIFGLTSQNPDTMTGTSFDLTKLNYGIKIPDISGSTPSTFYQSGTAGSFTNTTQNPSQVINDSTDNDTLQFCITEGRIEGQVWVNGVGVITLEDFGAYTYPDDLYPVVIFLDNDFQMKTYRFTPSPFHNLDDTYVPHIPLLGHTNEPKQPPSVPTKFNLIFEGDSLPTFLGYNNIAVPMPVGATRSGFTFRAIAENIYRPNNKSDALIVEFLNLTLMSYDGLVKDRKSYLNVITEDDSNGQILYDAPYPLYIDIDNANPLTLRNFKLRVLNNDLSQLNMRGLGTMVLLIKSPDE